MFSVLQWFIRKPIVVLCSLLTLSGFQVTHTMPAHAFAPQLQPANFSTTYLEQITTSTNTSANSTIINSPYTNGNPNAILLVNQDWNLDHSCGCVYNSHPIGTWYNAFFGWWEIFNEDNSAMPLNARFGVIVWSAPVQEAGRTIYTHVAGAQTGADYTDISNSISDHNPNALVFVTPNLNPPASGQSVYDNHVVGVWYDNGTGHWAIYNEDGAPMPSASAFNVVVYAPATDPTEVYAITSNATNTAFDYTNLSNDWSTQGGLVAIHVYTTCLKGGCPGFWNHALGSWYNSGAGHVSIFNEDAATMSYKLTFNVMNVHFG